VTVPHTGHLEGSYCAHITRAPPARARPSLQRATTPPAAARRRIPAGQRAWTVCIYVTSTTQKRWNGFVSSSPLAGARLLVEPEGVGSSQALRVRQVVQRRILGKAQLILVDLRRRAFPVRHASLESLSHLPRHIIAYACTPTPHTASAPVRLSDVRPGTLQRMDDLYPPSTSGRAPGLRRRAAAGGVVARRREGRARAGGALVERLKGGAGCKQVGRLPAWSLDTSPPPRTPSGASPGSMPTTNRVPPEHVNSRGPCGVNPRATRPHKVTPR